jgi:hypothetical protein
VSAAWFLTMTEKVSTFVFGAEVVEEPVMQG